MRIALAAVVAIAVVVLLGAGAAYAVYRYDTESSGRILPLHV